MTQKITSLCFKLQSYAKSSQITCRCKMYIEKSRFHFLFRKQCRCLIPMHLVNYHTIYPERPTEYLHWVGDVRIVFFSGLAVRRGKPHEELKKVIDKLGQSSVHCVVFHEEVMLFTFDQKV